MGKSGRTKRGKSVTYVGRSGVRLPTAPPTIKHKTSPPRNVPVRETAERKSPHPGDCECFFCDYDKGKDIDDYDRYNGVY